MYLKMKKWIQGMGGGPLRFGGGKAFLCAGVLANTRTSERNLKNKCHQTEAQREKRKAGRS